MATFRLFRGALLFCLLSFFLLSCENNTVIVNNLDERQANEIIVFLASKGISAEKMQTSSGGAGGGGVETVKFSLSVKPSQATEAMALLNQNGLPRIKGTNLLDLFAKGGLMSSDKEETIRYQAGLAEQIANMIRKIDGVIDADVQLSFPPPETTPGLPTVGATPKKITAAVYVKHQGILDDPNSHLIIKIKRLVAGSVTGLDINDVAVISDRSRFTDITLAPQMETLDGRTKEKEYVSIWSIVMSKNSTARFRLLFFTLTFLSLIFLLVFGWLIWKFYPILKRRGFKNLLHPKPIDETLVESSETPPEEKK